MSRCRRLPAVICGVLVSAGAAVAQGSVVQQAYLKASNAEAYDRFGASAAVSGDTLVVGAVGEDSRAAGVNGDEENDQIAQSGAAYVFVWNGSSWQQQAYLKASNPGIADQFGASVAISGDIVVVGANFEDSGATGVNGNEGDNSAQDAGAAYVFVRDGTSWTQQAYLKASNTDANDLFGTSVAVSGSTILVGASGEDSAATGIDGDQASDSAPGSGAAYVFVRSGMTWSQQAYLKASNTGSFDALGRAVALSGDSAVLAASGEDSYATGVDGNQLDNSYPSAGAAYVFVREGNSWSQQAYLKASNTEAGDEFGRSVSISGDTIAVGARWEDSDALGVDGDQASNDAPSAGAAYVFARMGATWSQQAYVKASNAATFDNFGEWVSVSDDRLVVGAPGEDSQATGVNGDQGDNLASGSGAAYLLARDGTTWSQQAYLKASNTDPSDGFGSVLAVSGDVVVVATEFEDSSSTGVNGNPLSNGAVQAGAAYAFELDRGAWTDLGFGLVGVSGVPLLTGSGSLLPGSVNQLDLRNANPASTATLVFGLAQSFLPFKGGLIVPAPLTLVPFVTDGLGAGTLPFIWPASAPADVSLHFQFWISDSAGSAGFSASNGLKGMSG